MKIAIFFLIIFGTILALILAFSPFVPQAKNYRISSKNASKINSLSLEALPAYLAKSEEKVGDVKKGAGKKINWFEKKIKKNKFSVIYVHGFSASLAEIRPLPDMVAEALGANIFYTRLAGHGRKNDGAMKQGTAKKWYRDIDEALAIAEKIGDEIIIMATSTGGTLATLSLQSQNPKVKALILFSPNYGLKIEGSAQLLPYVLNMPFAKKIISLVRGEKFNFKAINEEHKKWWSLQYPTSSVLPMQAVVEKMKTMDVSKIKTPAMFIFHKQDEVVDVRDILEAQKNWGGKTKVVNPSSSNHPENHIVAGKIFAPENNNMLYNEIINWIRSL